MKDKVNKFITDSNMKPLTHFARIADIQSELGELSKELLKATAYGEKDLTLNDDIKMEFGDTLFAILALAKELNINPDKCLDEALAKYRRRLALTGNIGNNIEVPIINEIEKL